MVNVQIIIPAKTKVYLPQGRIRCNARGKKSAEFAGLWDILSDEEFNETKQRGTESTDAQKGRVGREQRGLGRVQRQREVWIRL